MLLFLFQRFRRIQQVIFSTGKVPNQKPRHQTHPPPSIPPTQTAHDLSEVRARNQKSPQDLPVTGTKTNERPPPAPLETTRLRGRGPASTATSGRPRRCTRRNPGRSAPPEWRCAGPALPAIPRCRPRPLRRGPSKTSRECRGARRRSVPNLRACTVCRSRLALVAGSGGTGNKGGIRERKDYRFEAGGKKTIFGRFHKILFRSGNRGFMRRK